jgi:pimeloyl-ACP methyl ester carboxylesterase
MRPRFQHALLLAAAVLGANVSPRAAIADPLPQAPQSAESFDIGTIHVERFGSGPRTLVLIPGLGSGTWTWYGTIAHETARYTVYALTLPGFDGRPATQAPSLFAAFDRDFQSLLSTRRIRVPIVVGHSLGGTLAIYEAEQHPKEFQAIVAVDGLPIFPALASASPGDRAAAAGRITASIAGLDQAALLAYDRHFMSTIGIPFAEIMPYGDPPAGTAPSYTLDQTLTFYKSLVAGAPRVTVLPIEHARHYVMLDRPDAFYATLDGFLDSVDPART